MRKCVLSILGEIVMRVLHGENLDEDAKETRDQFLDCLEDHIHDVNAFVRSSVLQTWGKLCQNKTIPLNRQQRLLKLVIGRLRDKSSSVRKQSVQLLTTLLECNPFTASMSVEELRLQLEKEAALLKEMEPEVKDLGAAREEKEAEWLKIEEELFSNKCESVPSAQEQEEVWENAVENEVVVRLQHLLMKKKYGKACSLLASAKKAFPEHPLFGVDLDEKSALKAAYLAHAHATHDEDFINSQSQLSQGEGAVNLELEKQRILVAYLQDSVGFAEELNTALPTICLLLGSKQVPHSLKSLLSNLCPI